MVSVVLSRISKRFGSVVAVDQADLTTIYVTHNLADAMALADRIAVMRAGRFEQANTAENLVRQPANSYVADFFKASELRQKDIFVHKKL